MPSWVYVADLHKGTTTAMITAAIKKLVDKRIVTITGTCIVHDAKRSRYHHGTPSHRWIEFGVESERDQLLRLGVLKYKMSATEEFTAPIVLKADPPPSLLLPVVLAIEPPHPQPPMPKLSATTEEAVPGSIAGTTAATTSPTTTTSYHEEDGVIVID
ncbi:hypothetical protein Pelo_9530 [Pelomyxa schiedti]|nr:hypothetical protein Pelo_9530 [Pelomyxa schiedti]